MIRTLELSSLALAAAAAGFVVVLAVRRVRLARQARRVRDAEARLRPVVLALLDGESPPDALAPADAAVVAGVLARYARSLSGEPRDHIADFFARSGELERALRALRSRRDWRRAAAAFELGDMGAEGALAPLIEALADPSREVRSAAARSLGALGAVDAVEPLVEALADASVPRAVAGGALLRIGSEAVPALVMLAGAEDSHVRASAIELVGLLGDGWDGRAITHRMYDAAAEVRARTARALGRVGAAQASVELRGALSDRIPDVRAAAATALGDIGDRAAIVALWRQAREDSHEPARAAAQAVARIDPALVVELGGDGSAGPFMAEAADLAAVGALR